MKMQPITIDLRGHSGDAAYRARILWEKLFRLTHAEHWRSLDNFLCDLKTFTNMFENVYHKDGCILTFWWDFHAATGITNVHEENPGYTDDCCKVTIDYSVPNACKVVIESA